MLIRLNITEIWQLRRRKKAKAKITERTTAISALAKNFPKVATFGKLCFDFEHFLLENHSKY